MKIVKIICILLICLIIPVSCAPRVGSKECASDGKYVYLVAGLDDAAQNTDVLFCIGIDTVMGDVYVCQIPRDTYYNFGKSQNKINQIFSSARSEGLDEYASMKRLTSTLGASLGVDFDGYIAVGVSAFGNIVDALGGVELTLSYPMTIELDGEEPIYLHAGTNYIDSKAAEGFVRFRKGYVTADLGRMDAQKIFLNAIFHKLSRVATLPVLLKLAGILQASSFTDVKLTQLVGILFSGGNTSKASYFVTLPGDAVMSTGGVSYYSLCRDAAAKIAGKYLFSENEFDREFKFLKWDDEEFAKIYNSEDIYYKEYSNETVKDIPLSKR